MTCIAAVRDEFGVVIGADSRINCGPEFEAITMPKILRIGDILIGMAGELRAMHALTYHLKVAEPTSSEDSVKFICSDLMVAIRKCLVRHGLEIMITDHDASLSLLVAYRGRLFTGSTLGDMREKTHPVGACGSGGDYAIGYLHATAHHNPEPRVLGALECASNYDSGCGPPFILMRSPVCGSPGPVSV